MGLIAFLKSLFGPKQKTKAEIKRERRIARYEKKEAEKKAAEKKELEAQKVKDDFMTSLRKDLERDEGVKYEVYRDHLGFETFGIGHLVKEHDPEWGMKTGTKVSKERVQQAFEEDMKTTLEDCHVLFGDFHNEPEEVRLIIANMAFNLGRRRLSRFKNFRAAVNAKDYAKAADEMKDSRWYSQVTNRAERLRKRMLAVANT